MAKRYYYTRQYFNNDSTSDITPTNILLVALIIFVALAFWAIEKQLKVISTRIHQSEADILTIVNTLKPKTSADSEFYLTPTTLNASESVIEVSNKANGYAKLMEFWNCKTVILCDF